MSIEYNVIVGEITRGRKNVSIVTLLSVLVEHVDKILVLVVHNRVTVDTSFTFPKKYNDIREKAL